MAHDVHLRESETMFLFTRLSILLAVVAICAPATTLELLGFDGLIDKATVVVRGRVSGCEGAYRGAMIYTHCSVAVLETLKGAPASQVRFAVPGGKVGNIRQSIAGSPQFQSGGEYVLFLWTSSTGFTQCWAFPKANSTSAPRTPSPPPRATPSPTSPCSTAWARKCKTRGVRMTLPALRQRMASRLTRSVQK